MTMDSFTESNLQAILEKIAHDEGFRLPKFAINMAVKPGVNFVGRIFRVVITETAEEKGGAPYSLIFKASSANKARNVGLSADIMFRTESEMYEIVLPTLNKFLKKHGLSDTPTFPGTPRCFKTELNDDPAKDEVEVVVLEDLKERGFTSVDVKTCLDGHQCRVILQKLAVLHASSLALRHHEPNTADYLENTILKNQFFNKEKDLLLDDMKKGSLAGLELLGGLYKKGYPLYDKLHDLLDDYHNEVIRLNEVPPDLSCILHGDCWSNNILYKFGTDGILEDVCLIDFQLSHVGSPALDIVYMIFLCTSKEVRDVHYDDLIRSYHEEVTKTLRALRCDPEKIMPWDLLQKHLRSHGKYALLMTICGIPVLLSDQIMDLHSSEEEGAIFSDTGKITKPETFKKVSQRLTGIVEDCERLGFI